MLPPQHPRLKRYSHFLTITARLGRTRSGSSHLQRHSDDDQLHPTQPLATGNIFTTGLVGWPGAPHISEKDFAPVITKALEMPGFQEDKEAGSVMVGFGHGAVLNVATKVIELIKEKRIRHFFLVAGCDGAKPGRNYYTEFVEKVPKDCVVLTLACGKFRFFDKDLGDIGGLPRLLTSGSVTMLTPRYRSPSLLARPSASASTSCLSA
jgi:hypothetical protein